MKVPNNMLLCVLFYLILKIFRKKYFIAKETGKCVEVMKFMKITSLTNGKLDLNSGLVTPPN